MSAPPPLPPLGRMRGGHAPAGPQAFRPKNNLLDDEVLDDDTRRMLMEDIQRGRMPASRAPIPAVAVASPLLGVVAPAPPPGAPPAVAGVGRSNMRGPLTPPLIRSTAAVGTNTAGAGGGTLVHSAPGASSVSAYSSVCSPVASPAAPSVATAMPSPASPLVTPADDGATSSLVTVLGSRLAFLEKQVAFLQAELKEKNLKLIETRDRLDEATAAVSRGQDERHILARRLAEQNAFLAEYGLTFVGTSSGSGTPTPRPGSGRSRGEAASEVTGQGGKDGVKFDLWAGGWPGTAQPAPTTAAPGPVSTSAAAMSGSTSGSGDARPAPTATSAVLRRASIADLSSRSPRQTAAPRDPNAPAAPHVPFDYEKFLTKCEHLTATVGFVGVTSGEKNPAAVGGGPTARLQHREIVRIIVFADGITVHGGAFRPYGWALCDAFIQDILDGFFPYEYRDKFPEGFPIEVIDRRGEAFLAAATAARAQQARHGAGPYKNIATLVGGRVVGGTDGSDGLAGATVSRADLLKRLPQQHITATGKMLDIRAGIAAFLAGPHHQAGAPSASSASPTTPAHYDAGSELPLRVPTAAGVAYDASTAQGVESGTARLQVRFPDGQRLQLRLYAHETVGDLRAAVLAALRQHPHLAHALFRSAAGDAVRSWAFQLTSAFPRTTWGPQNDAKTLSAAGLAPSANLFVNVASSSAPVDGRSAGRVSH